jgi:hypothetical protein
MFSKQMQRPAWNCSEKRRRSIVRAAARRKTIISNDVSKSALYIKVVDDVRSEMAVPLLARRRLIGVIDFESTQPNAFGKYGGGCPPLDRVADCCGDRKRATPSQDRYGSGASADPTERFPGILHDSGTGTARESNLHAILPDRAQGLRMVI